MSRRLKDSPPPKIEDLPDPMKIAEVAALLRVWRGIVMELIHSGKLKALTLGGGKRPMYLIRKADYLSWFNGEGK